MKRRLAVGFGVALGIALLAVWAFFSHADRSFNHRVHKLEVTFISDRSQLEALVALWPRLEKTMDSCGAPSMSPGLVHFAAIGRMSDGKIRVAQDPASTGGFDAVVASIPEGAARIGASAGDLSNYLKTMDSLSFTVAYQHDAEVHLVQDDDAALSLMYVPSNCRQFSNYPFWNRNSNNNQLTPFALIHQLSPSWFLVEDQR